MAFWGSIIPYTFSRSTSTPSASTTPPFSSSISSCIPVPPPPPPWQWWSQLGTSPWGKTWAQRQADSTFLISMNERMIRKHIEDSFLFPRSCDVRIICGDTVFLAHKIVLCHLSRFFKAAFHGKFRESCGTLTITDRDPMLVEKVLEYLYTANYTLIPDKQEIEEINSDGSENSSLDGKSVSPRWKRSSNKRKRFSIKNMFHFFGVGARPMRSTPLYDRLFHSAAYFHLRVYAEADYFMIDELKVKAETGFCKEFEKLLTMELIFKKEYEAQFTISKIIGELYSRRGSYSVLREMVLELMINNMPGLRQTIFMAPTEGCLFLSLHPGFAADLCWGMIEKTFPSDMPTYYPTIMPEQFASWERQFKMRTGLS